MMTRSARTLLVVLLVVAAVAVPTVGAVQPAASNAQETTPDDGTAGNGSVAPGERLSGVVGVQQEELDGDVESRAFGIRVENAESDAAKAEIVAQRHDQNEQRLEELQQRLETLEQARENGSMSQGTYAARVAQTHTEIRNVQRSSNETAAVAADLPAETLRANGVDPEAIDRVRTQASELGGPEVAAIARSIAGPSADRAPPERTGALTRGNRSAVDRPGGDRGPNDGARPADGDATGSSTATDAEPADDQSGANKGSDDTEVNR